MQKTNMLRVGDREVAARLARAPRLAGGSAREEDWTVKWGFDRKIFRCCLASRGENDPTVRLTDLKGQNVCWSRERGDLVAE
jgi:hypothetical protein